MLAVKATPGAMEDLKEATEKKGARLTPAEAVMTAAPHYIPAGISGLLTCGCMLASTHGLSKRAAGAAAAATIAQNALADTMDKVEEKFGKEKAQETRDEIISEKLASHHPESGQILRTGRGDHLCYDIYSDRYFYSDVEDLRRAANNFNHQLLGEMWLCLNEWYSHIGLPSIAYGYDIGWNADCMLELSIGTQIAADGHTPCITVDFQHNHTPRFGYDSPYSGMRS